jgi:hypothetical protein
LCEFSERPQIALIFAEEEIQNKKSAFIRVICGKVLSCCHQREFFWMFNAFQIQIHAQFWPMKMIPVGKFHVDPLAHRRVAEPRKTSKPGKCSWPATNSPKPCGETRTEN